MKNLLCILGFHNFDKWKEVDKLNIHFSKLSRKCVKCNHIEEYEGLVEIDIINSEVSPYEFKN